MAGPRAQSLSQDGINSSQLGFRGVEDLGGGLKAGFNLLAGVNADTGTASQLRKFSNRRSTVSLFSNAGELRLGRDYTPTFWNQTIFDAFGTNGLGSSPTSASGTAAPVRTTRSATSCRRTWAASTARSWSALPKAAPRLDRPARYIGGRFGFAAGPFDVAGCLLGSEVRVASASLDAAPTAASASSFRPAPRRRPGTSVARGTSAS